MIKKYVNMLGSYLRGSGNCGNVRLPQNQVT